MCICWVKSGNKEPLAVRFLSANTTVPNVAGYIVHAGGRDTLLHKVNSMVQAGGKAAMTAVTKL